MVNIGLTGDECRAAECLEMTSEPKNIIPVKQFVLWVLVSALVVFVISLMAAQLAPGIKKLILFHAVLGLVLGLCLRKLAIEFECLHSRRVVVYGAVLILLGSLQLAGISFQNYYEHKQALARQNPKQLAALNMLEKISGDEPEHMLKYAEARREFEPQFSDYLKMRTSTLGNWNTPWPCVLWVFELLIAATTGGWVLARQNQTARN